MIHFSAINLILLVGAICYQETSAAPPSVMNKVFYYEGAMPIKEGRNGNTVKNDGNETEIVVTPQNDLSEAEAACWTLINEQSAVTFALQKRVIIELKEDMKDLPVEDDLREAIEKITSRMQTNMDEALEALKRDAADEYFDALFDSSEDIIHLSAILRDPKLEEKVFLTLVKAVSRLGRNNANLIQQFTDMCSFIKRSPQPRIAHPILGL